MTRKPADPQKVEALYGEVFGKVEGAFTCALAWVGDRLGLYRALGEEPHTSEELAASTGLDHRWVTEWLRQQTAAGLLEHDAGRFGLSPEAEEVLANEEGPFFGAGIFGTVVGLFGTLDRLEDSFRTGIGAPYDSFGHEFTRGLERMMAPFYRTRLVQDVLPSLEGVLPKLEAGAKVADVGCGSAVALTVMAQAFPRSTFHGYDSSKLGLARGRRNVAAAGVPNVTLHDASHARLPGDGSFDLITTLDVIHDMTDPVGTIAAIKASLVPDGTWFCADIKGQPTFEENLRSQPLAGMLYGFSVTCCMRSALAEEGGAGLGTLGFHEDQARSMSEAAGFTRFRTHDFDNPINDYYEIRP